MVEGGAVEGWVETGEESFLFQLKIYSIEVLLLNFVSLYYSLYYSVCFKVIDQSDKYPYYSTKFYMLTIYFVALIFVFFVCFTIFPILYSSDVGC